MREAHFSYTTNLTSLDETSHTRKISPTVPKSLLPEFTTDIVVMDLNVNIEILKRSYSKSFLLIDWHDQRCFNII
jgi:hypothetical protein